MTLLRSLVSARWVIMPDRQSVYYAEYNGQDQWAPSIEVPNSEVRQSSKEERRSVEAGVDTETRTFVLWTEFLGGTAKRNARIVWRNPETDDLEPWIVKHVSVELLDQRNRLVCFRDEGFDIATSLNLASPSTPIL